MLDRLDPRLPRRQGGQRSWDPGDVPPLPSPNSISLPSLHPFSFLLPAYSMSDTNCGKSAEASVVNVLTLHPANTWLRRCGCRAAAGAPQTRLRSSGTRTMTGGSRESARRTLSTASCGHRSQRTSKARCRKPTARRYRAAPDSRLAVFAPPSPTTEPTTLKWPFLVNS